MTRGEEFERLQFRATREKNNSLVESLFHPDRTYESGLVQLVSKNDLLSNFFKVYFVYAFKL